MPHTTDICAVGHRVVHGGAKFRHSVRIDAGVKAEIEKLSELAPLHNPPALHVIDAAQLAFPDVPQVAVFDTSFFANLPPSAAIYPLPYQWYTDFGIRRFGFHGISHAYCAFRAAELLQSGRKDLCLVVCHLGNGCSATAIRDGTAVATTMGFTPLDGLMMGSRSGAIDPGILMYLQRRCGIDIEQLDHELHHNSGLLGVSGISSDFREVEAAAHNGNQRARLSLDMYAQKVRAAIGALAVTLGRIDALIFTAGVGENSTSLRSGVCSGLECLGVTLDERLNESARPDTDIAEVDASTRVLLIHTREDLMIAREARDATEAERRD